MSETGEYFEAGSSVLSGSINGCAQGSEEFLGAWDDGAILKAFDEAIRGHTVRGADKAAVLKAREEAVQQEGIASGGLKSNMISHTLQIAALFAVCMTILSWFSLL
jgi:hypothetical protein